MVLTPIDVQQKTFATAMRGYDLDEVDDFLDNVVIALKDYEQRLRDAQERIATLENDLSKRSDEESAISRALVAAQRSADALVEDAREEAQRILADAETQASELEGERDEERRLLQDEIDAIRSRTERLRTGVATMLTSISAGLDDIDRFVDEQGEEPFESPAQATFDAAAPMEAVESEETVSEVETFSEKIVIDGTDDFEGPESAEDAGSPWGVGAAASDEDLDAPDDDYDGSPSLDEITDRIDAAFGDIEDSEEDDDGDDGDDASDPWGDHQDADGLRARPWED